jgi:hypothetical protein
LADVGIDLGRFQIPERADVDAGLRAYECPEQSAKGTWIMTSYVAVVGPGTAWPGATAARIEDIRDGTSNTLMVVEIADSGIHWMEPRDLDAATMAVSVNSKDGLGISSLHRHPGWQRQRLGANVGLADGSVLFLPTSTSETKIRALLTAVGGEPVERDPRWPDSVLKGARGSVLTPRLRYDSGRRRLPSTQNEVPSKAG